MVPKIGVTSAEYNAPAIEALHKVGVQLMGEVEYAPNFMDNAPLREMLHNGRLGSSMSPTLNAEANIVETQYQWGYAKNEELKSTVVSFGHLVKTGQNASRVPLNLSMVVTSFRESSSFSATVHRVFIERDKLGEVIIIVTNEDYKVQSGGSLEAVPFMKAGITISSKSVNYNGIDQTPGGVADWTSSLLEMGRNRMVELCGLFGIDSDSIAEA